MPIPNSSKFRRPATWTAPVKTLKVGSKNGSEAKSQRVTKGRAQKVTNKKKVTKKVTNKKKATYFMEDPNGDEGWFTGFVDAKGQANGIGKLQYNIGMIIFVGQFSGGAINEGVVYEEGVPVFAMKAGHWLMEVDNGLVRKFPSSFAEAEYAEYNTSVEQVTSQEEYTVWTSVRWNRVPHRKKSGMVKLIPWLYMHIPWTPRPWSDVPYCKQIYFLRRQLKTAGELRYNVSPRCEEEEELLVLYRCGELQRRLVEYMSMGSPSTAVLRKPAVKGVQASQ